MSWGWSSGTASDDTEQCRVGHKRYPSVSRIAADPWLRGVATTEEGQRRLAALRSVCEELARAGLLNRIDGNLYPQYSDFLFEGTALYRTRHHELEETLEEEDDLTPLFDKLRSSLAAVEHHARDSGLGAEPGPYAAIIVADGDRMGAAISVLESADKHRRFSRELAQFAFDAAKLVPRFQGVLAITPAVTTCWASPPSIGACVLCARELHSLFKQTMAKALPDTPEAERPTLSVGVAIGHFLENLEDLLAYGRGAEKHAKKQKPDRNGLAVHLHKRGGGPVKVRKQWTTNLDSTLSEAAGWFFSGAVSNRTPYELDRLAAVYDGWPEESLGQAMRSDAARIIDRKRPTGTENQMARIQQLPPGHSRHQGTARVGERTSHRPASRRGVAAERRRDSMTTYCKCISGRDPLVARDGRPLAPGQGNRMRSSGWLYPSVVAGSFRTALAKAAGRDFDEATQNELLRIDRLKRLALWPWAMGNCILLPAPNDCVLDDKGRVFQARPENARRKRTKARTGPRRDCGRFSSTHQAISSRSNPPRFGPAANTSSGCSAIRSIHPRMISLPERFQTCARPRQPRFRHRSSGRNTPVHHGRHRFMGNATVRAGTWPDFASWRSTVQVFRRDRPGGARRECAVLGAASTRRFFGLAPAGR